MKRQDRKLRESFHSFRFVTLIIWVSLCLSISVNCVWWCGITCEYEFVFVGAHTTIVEKFQRATHRPTQTHTQTQKRTLETHTHLNAHSNTLHSKAVAWMKPRFPRCPYRYARASMDRSLAKEILGAGLRDAKVQGRGALYAGGRIALACCCWTTSFAWANRGFF